jgi:hypothetical protein
MDELLKLANASGYFFQDRLREEIDQANGQHGWRVAAEEHRWCGEDGQEGFIDLVLENSNLRIVVEAKRTRDASWVFLVPQDSSGCSVVRSRCLWTYRSQGEPPKLGWRDASVLPTSPEARFCVIRGQGDRDQPMLERLGGILLRSTESLAEEEIRIGSPPQFGAGVRIYFPMIVTNAQMYVCFYDPKSVDLATGELPEGKFQELNFLRFRKGLSTRWPISSDTPSLRDANREKERTLFIVKGENLLDVLRQWDI